MAENEVDMFSILSDSLLFIIISFLPFKDAARTSILSRRWRNIWLSTKNIELYESFFVKQHNESGEIQENQRNIFINFTRNWTQNYPEPIAHKFCLVFSKPNETHLLDIQNFIQFAITRKVKLLELDFSDPTWNEECLINHEPVIELPLFADEHADLKAVKLFSCKFRVPEFCYFRTLKSISLGWIRLTTSSIAALLSHCVLLEELSLKKCWDLGQLYIRSSNLRTLVIDKCLSLEDGVIIDAQNLCVFKYSGPVIPFDLLDLDSLAEVDLDFGLEDEYNRDYGEIFYRLLSGIYFIKVLTVCGYMLQVMPTAEEPLSLQPPLNVVEHLTLNTSLDSKEYFGITFFLHSCPHLQTLSIDLHTPKSIFNEDQNRWLADQEMHQFSGESPYVIVYACLKRWLKVVEVKGFKGEMNELLVIQYFIKYGRVLERLVINISDEKGENGEVLGFVYRFNALKLFSINRASPNLLILIK